MNTLRAAIAEDHKIFRKGLILSLKPYKHIEFVAEAGDGKELIDLLDERVLPDIVLMDIRMPGMDGIEATLYLKKHFPQVHVICLTMFDEQQFVDKMMQSGACRYLLKNSEPGEINATMLQVIGKDY